MLLLLVLVIVSLVRRWLARSLNVSRVQFSDVCRWGRRRREPPKLHENILHLFPGLGIPYYFLVYIIPIELAIRNLISCLTPDKLPRLLNLLQRGKVPLKSGSHNLWVVGFEGK